MSSKLSKVIAIAAVAVIAGAVIFGAIYESRQARPPAGAAAGSAGTPTTMTPEAKDACYRQPYEDRTPECHADLAEHREAVSAKVRSTSARTPSMTCDRAVQIDSGNEDHRWTRSVNACTESQFRTIITRTPGLNCGHIRALGMLADNTTAARWWAGIVLDYC